MSFCLLSRCSLWFSLPVLDLLGVHVPGLPNMILAGEGRCSFVGIALMLSKPLFTFWPGQSIFSRGLMCCTAQSARPLPLAYHGAGCRFNSP